MNDLRNRIADALYTAPAEPTEAAEKVARRTAERDADAVIEAKGANTVAGRADEFVEVERVIVRLAQLDLPGAEAAHVRRGYEPPIT